MTRPAIGVVAGGVLGFIDGMSAWFYPEARSMMLTIILGSTIKGILTGLSVGFVANRKQSVPLASRQVRWWGSSSAASLQ
jgi:hypothetical protein